jgi:hypothetical protein
MPLSDQRVGVGGKAFIEGFCSDAGSNFEQFGAPQKTTPWTGVVFVLLSKERLTLDALGPCCGIQSRRPRTAPM